MNRIAKIGLRLAQRHMESDSSGVRVKRGTDDKTIAKLVKAGLVDDYGEPTNYGVDVVCNRFGWR